MTLNICFEDLFLLHFKVYIKTGFKKKKAPENLMSREQFSIGHVKSSKKDRICGASSVKTSLRFVQFLPMN